MDRMSTNSTGKTNTGAAISVSAGSTGSKISSMFTGTPAMIILTILGFGMFITAFVSSASFVGSKDDWNQVQPQINRVTIYTIIGTVLLMIAVLLFFIQDSAKAMYFILASCCVSLGLSFAALCVAAISR